MKLSIIIINWNTKDLTKHCIESIKLNDIKYEIILVDNGSSESIEDLKKLNPNIRIIKNKQNLYFARANNEAFSVSKGKYILLLGSDTIIRNGAIEKLLDFLDNNSEYSIVAPQLLNKDLSIQPSCRNFPTLPNVIKSFFDINHKSKFFGEYKLSYWDHNESRNIVQPQATAIMIRRDIIEKYGLFDEQFPLYFNDVDFFRKMYINNKKIYFLKDAQIIHLYGQSSKKLGMKRRILLYKGYLQYLLKWGII